MKYKPVSDSLASFYAALASTPDECTYLDLSSLDFLPFYTSRSDISDILHRISSLVGKIPASVDYLDLSKNFFTPHMLAIFLSSLSKDRTFKVLDLRKNYFFSMNRDAQNVTSLTSQTNFSASLYNSASWHAQKVIFSGSELARMSKLELNNFAKIFPWYVRLTVLNERNHPVVSENIKYFRKKIMSGFLHHANTYDKSLLLLMKNKNLPADTVGIIASYLSLGGGFNAQNKYLKYSRTFFSYKMAMEHHDAPVENIKAQQMDDMRRLNTRPIEISLFVLSAAFILCVRTRFNDLSEQQKNALLFPLFMFVFIITALRHKNQIIQSAQYGFLKNIMLYMQLPFEIVPFNPYFDDHEIAMRKKRPNEHVEDEEDEEDAAFRNHPSTVSI